MIRLTLPLIALSLMGCVPASAPPQPVSTAPTACGSEKIAQFVGKKRTDAIAKQVAELSGAQGIRWIKPGTAVTMDYREGRLNVYLDAKGKITRVSCG